MPELDNLQANEPIGGSYKDRSRTRKGMLPAPIIWWPLVVGAFCVLAAIAVEHGIWVHADGIPSGATTADHHSTAPSRIFNFSVPILWLAEIGYALIIAWVVAIAIEAGSRKEHNQAIEESRRLISQDVFQGVYSIRHDPDYVRSVISTCLEETLMRENYSLSYKVESLSGKAAEAAGDAKDKLVLVTVTVRYDLRNVGPADRTYTSTYGIPVREGPLEEHAKVTLIQIADETIEGEALRSRGKKTDDGELDYEFRVELQAQESKEVLIEAVLVKDMSDNDTFGFRRPTMGATIRLDVSVPGLKFGASERTASTMKVVRAPHPGRTAEWKVDGPILPFNSVNLWWRPSVGTAIEDDVAKVAAHATVYDQTAQVEPASDTPR